MKNEIEKRTNNSILLRAEAGLFTKITRTYLLFRKPIAWREDHHAEAAK